MDEAICEVGLSNERQGHLSSLDGKDKVEHSASSSSENEKERMSADVEVALAERAEDESDTSRTINTDDPFPIDPHSPVEERQFTLRAVLVGCSLGAIIAASNVYLGLKAGPLYATLFSSS